VLLSAAQAGFEALGSTMWPTDQVEFDRNVDATRALLDEESFAQAWTEGQGMSLDEALAYALGEQFPVGAQSVHPPDQYGAGAVPAVPVGGGDANLPNELTPREGEVLQLVAAGLSNAEIAERLSLSINTVESHLRSIYGKLGVTRRSAATRFALEHKLV
jgi:DNA-binding NarL/FixJ family response regulator